MELNPGDLLKILMVWAMVMDMNIFTKRELEKKVLI
jgi:hypothetical protein